ncbi:TRAP transporter, DctM subunit [Noviherbaspirillum humi]|uniref:TRAP transporter, DctM subunit n=1 Tax=Noviherbaspirillum humi TaxID=1688639 RepID=A0A239LHV6_9BURK|nr:TRAP transporter large permease subunit [Noviherbaspirillum humi]SNT30237.1 TRAP transporter, DctM subunit [Noviherbaspirillum humi]
MQASSVGHASGVANRRPLFLILERGLAAISEIPAAILVALEILVLLAGVTARYVFNAPLTWSDELASILFLWLAMLGAVIALRRGEHMRLTTLVNRLQPGTRGWVTLGAELVVATFVLEIILPAHEYFQDQWAISTPALEIQDGLRVAAIGIGAVLMMAIILMRLAEHGSKRQLGIGLLFFVALAAALWFARPVFMKLGNLNLLIFFVVMVAVCVACAVPIAFAFGVATLSYLALTTNVPLTIVVSRMDEGMSSLILLSVPLFVFLGVLIEMTGLAKAMVDFLASLLGHVRGGLAYVLLGAMYLVSGISGSKAADMAAVAPALFPEMKRRGSDEGRLIALLSSSGAMSETIPPSLVLITIGSVTGVSIAALFTGGLLPALVGAAALAVVVFFHSRNENMTGVKRATGRQIARAFIVALPALALPFVIRAVVVEGVATATEVSTVGIVYTVIVGLLIYRQFDWKRLYPMLVETASLSGAILFIIGCATAMAWALTQSGFSRQLAAVMSAMPGGSIGFMAISVVAFVILGSVLEGIPAIVLFGPLLFPVARAVGIHEVHYAMVVIFAMGLGLFAPPFGVGFYAACAIGRVNPDQAMRHVWPYLGALFIALILIAAIPWISIGFL